MKRTSFTLSILALAAVVAGATPSTAQEDWEKYGPLNFTQFCNATPWGGVDTGYGEWWGSLSGEDLSRSINAQYTGAERTKRLAEAFRQGTKRISKPCRKTPGVDWAALDAQTGKDELGRKWSYGPQTCQIIETMMCDRKGAFFDPGGTSGHSACQTQIKAYLKANPVSMKESIWYWGGDAPVTYNEVIYSCADSGPPVVPVDPDNSTVNVEVKIEKPKLPIYSRDGSTLKKAHDDFVGKR